MEIQSENLEQVKEEIKDLKGRAKAAKRAMRQSKADKAEKNSKFAATLSQLRRERGISQKKAAGDLGISQALLSHYEKRHSGVRAGLCGQVRRLLRRNHRLPAGGCLPAATDWIRPCMPVWVQRTMICP